MMKLLVLAVALACASALVLKEAQLPLQTHWAKLDRTAGEQMMTVHIFVKQTNLDELQRIFNAVSNPQNPKYGQHLSNEEVHRLVAPTAESVKTVLTWLASNGITWDQITASPNSDILEFTVPVSVVESLLNTEYFEHQHLSNGYVFSRTAAYYLPEHVAPHIDFVGPTTRMPSMRKIRSHAPRGNGLSVVPSNLRSMYQVGDYKSTNSNNSLALCGFLEQYASQSDANTFFSKFDKDSSGRKIEFVGPNKQSSPGDEAMLDVEYGMALGKGVARSVFWYTAGRMPNTTSPDNEPYLQWLADVSKANPAPLIFSISYGDDEPTVPFDYGSRCNAEFMKAGARGITILVASGDSGVGSSGGGCNKFVGQWPAASPYVTSVGGTTSSPEEAVDFSGGGFSNYWGRPDFQTDAVNQYFKVAKNLPPTARYNHTSRGWPDVSAYSTDFTIIVDGFEEDVDGTSCSTPTFAGIVALLNDIRLQAGKAPLGFVAPLFYQNPSAFNDITQGNNPGCGTEGFYAAPGWDPVSGLGSPNFAKLSNVVKSLP